ncbi:endopolyphosphatase [Sporothrix schenckii 1099-18]|uniref:Endopolyphosphatase n=1 Tax=Sporothrix schenckii 1099-18 TaxID=1397361 RepID=A0A0F2LW65_SPOSC|nr:endopolyphosphatase [Sporothrix schenckii 1099-18]KJR81698.1 endopolyphosphatase [Sporothrix schenckii 1099-18]
MRHSTTSRRQRAAPTSMRSASLSRLLPLVLYGTAAVASPLGRLPQVFARPGGSQRVLGDAPGEAASSPRRLHGKFLHITDLHPDEFYKVHSSTSEEHACHSGKGPAGTYGAETSDCDTPYSLINATFDWIAENIRDDIDFVVWTGDSARHDSDERIPRSPAQVQNSNQLIADKFVDLFEDPSGQGLRIPIIPTFGNNDILPHNVLLPGPNKWLKRYTDIWSRFIPQEQRHSFEFGGWFYVEVIPNRLAVFSLNTLYFFDRNAGIDDCVQPSEPGFKQLEWLRIQLQFLRERGVKAILTGHVPPARTGSKQLWDETCWQKYTLWLRQYRDVIVSGLYGHMNVDHFMLQDTKELNYKLIGASRAEIEGLSLDEDEDDDDAYDYDEPEAAVRTNMEDDMDILSTADYLQELRSEWSKLPKPRSLDDSAVDGAEADDGEVDPEKKKKKGKKDKKNKKNKKKKGPKLSRKWAERYQLTFVSPSIVPNYLPALRVVEYNISGMEEADVWTDGPSLVPVLPEDELPPLREEKKGKKGKKGENDADKDKSNGKKDPNLVVPKGPAKTAEPGPAYSPQPLTLRGYVQYFANLTYINNDMTVGVGGADGGDDNVESDKWREGDHSEKSPKTSPAQPHKFMYQVEYSTFTDKIYNLSDMTVNSLLEMAYRMGKKTSKKSVADVGGDEVVKDGDDANDDASDDEDDADFEDAGGKKKKKKDKKKKEEQNQVWLHFLRHAFVSSVSIDKLKKIGD